MLTRSKRGAPAAAGGLIFISNSTFPSAAVTMWLVMIQFFVIVSMTGLILLACGC